MLFLYLFPAGKVAKWLNVKLEWSTDTIKKAFFFFFFTVDLAKSLIFFKREKSMLPTHNPYKYLHVDFPPGMEV